MTLKRKKILLIFPIIIAFFAFLLIIILFMDVNKYRPRIEKTASEALGMDVRIEGKIRMGFFPFFGISLEKVSIKNRGMDFISANKVRIVPKLVPLIKREVRINEIELIRPVIAMERDRSGMFNFEKSRQKSLQGEEVPPALPDIGKFAVSQGEFAYVDRKSGNRIEAKDFDLTIKNFSPDRGRSYDPLKNLSFEGNYKCKEIMSKNFKFSNFRFSIKSKDGIFDINPITVNSSGKDEKGSIKIDLTGEAPFFSVHYSASKYPFEKFASMFSQKKIMRGETDLSLNLITGGKGLDEMRRRLNGRASLRGENLLLYSFDLDSLLSKIEKSQSFSLVDIGAFFFVGPLGTVVTKGYDFAGVYKESRGGEGRIKKLVSEWKIQNGIAEAEDVALSTKQNRIALRGRINFVSERFDDMTIAAVDEKGCVRFSQKIHGPFNNPQIEKVSALKSIAGPAFKLLEKTRRFLAGGKCEVFYAGSVKHPQ